MSNDQTKQVLCPRYGEPMHVISYKTACDWDGNPHEFNYVAYSCNQCYDDVVDQNGNKVVAPIPNGYLVSGGRSNCPYCGMYLRSSPGSQIFYRDLGVAKYTSGFYGRRCFFCGLASPKYSGSKNQVFSQYINIPSKVLDEWYVDVLDILDSRCKKGSDNSFKFAYSPKSREFIMFSEKGYDSTIRLSFSEAIHKYGSKRLENYVCGRVFKKSFTEEWKVFLKIYENEWWMMETHFLLRRMGIEKEISIISKEII